jgi:hypothetical protein
MEQHNTNFRRARYKRPILGNLAQVGPSMPYTVGKPEFKRFFYVTKAESRGVSRDSHFNFFNLIFFNFFFRQFLLPKM